MDRAELGGGGEEEVGFEPSLLPWQHLAVRRGKCAPRQRICTENTAETCGDADGDATRRQQRISWKERPLTEKIINFS